MPNYRRAKVSGGTFFFTVLTHGRRELFHLESNRTILGEVFRECQQAWPFEVNAIVLLPDHLHTIWTLPTGDHHYSGRWSVIKTNFTKRFLAGGGSDATVSTGKRSEHRRGVWQRRFWEHTIANDDDFQTHLDYIHFNPVKHGLAECPRDWPASSFHRWVELGAYSPDWACSQHPKPEFPAAADDFGEAY